MSGRARFTRGVTLTPVAWRDPGFGPPISVTGGRGRGSNLALAVGLVKGARAADSRRAESLLETSGRSPCRDGGSADSGPPRCFAGRPPVRPDGENLRRGASTARMAGKVDRPGTLSGACHLPCLGGHPTGNLTQHPGDAYLPTDPSGCHSAPCGVSGKFPYAATIIGVFRKAGYVAGPPQGVSTIFTLAGAAAAGGRPFRGAIISAISGACGPDRVCSSVVPEGEGVKPALQLCGGGVRAVRGSAWIFMRLSAAVSALLVVARTPDPAPGSSPSTNSEQGTP